MQPLLTAASAGWLLGERVNARQWAGLTLGFIGLALVVSGKLGVGAELGPMLIPALVALLGITAGTLYQKRFCTGFDLRTGSVIQFGSAPSSPPSPSPCSRNSRLPGPASSYSRSAGWCWCCPLAQSVC